MATTSVRKQSGLLRSGPAPEVGQLTRRPFKPIKWFAGIGVLYLSACAYSMTRWLLGGHAKATHSGPTPVPEWMANLGHFNEIFHTGLAVLCMYFVVWRPWRKNGHLSLDGVVALSFITMWFQDPMQNVIHPYLSYNSALVNLGCPQCYMPGWIGHVGNMPEPILFAGLWYAGFLYFVAKAGVLAIQWCQRRWPKLGLIGVWGIMIVPLLIFDILTEMYWIIGGMYGYYGAYGMPKWMLLFSGHYFAIPLSEVFFAAFFYLVFIALWHYRNDKGQMLSDRGIEKVRYKGGKLTALRWLGLVGMFNLGFFLVYTLPFTSIFTLRFNDWPEDVQKRSYFMNGICGEGTGYMCPDPRLPIPVGNSARIAPDGTLVTPKGLPKMVPLERG